MNHRRTVLALAMLLIFSQTLLASKESMKQGWEAFNKNKRKEAIEFFQKAANDADTKADANLALTLVWWSEDKNKEGFKAFQKFFDGLPKRIFYATVVAYFTHWPSFS